MKVCKKYVMYFTILSIAAILTGCGGGGGGGGTPPPVANAGPDQNVMVGSLVTLDASGSTGLVSSITWTFTSKPAGSAAALSSSVATKPTFTADLYGSYVLSLKIGNGSVMSSPDTVTVRAVHTRAIPDTGQTTCYDAAGSVIGCLGSGQDAAYNLISLPSYTDPGDGTITDNITGLMWQKCTAGLNALTCSGTLSVYNWYQATGTADGIYNPGGVISACSGTFLGHSDWRLPTDFELMTIANYGTYSMATNTTYFPATSSAFYWSSTGSYIGSYAWSIEFYEGTMLTPFKYDSSKVVRCVRGEQSALFLTDNGDGTITDKVTGLIWQKQDDGLTKTWAQALNYCETLVSAGSSSWRVPNIKELRSIVDTTKYGPSVNTVYFPSTAIYPYWSSTTVARFKNQAWTVDFNSGSVDNTVNKTLGSYVRCLR